MSTLANSVEDLLEEQDGSDQGTDAYAYSDKVNELQQLGWQNMDEADFYVIPIGHDGHTGCVSLHIW